MEVSRTSFATNDFDSEKTQTWTTIAICLIFIGVGIPVWWKTTEVYRAVLPFNEITQLHSERNLMLKVTLEIGDTGTGVDLHLFAKEFLEVLSVQDSSLSAQVVYDTKISEDLSSNLITTNVPSNFIRVLFSPYDDNNGNAFKNIEVTNGRTILCRIPKDKSKDSVFLNDLQLILSSTIRNVLVNEGLLSEMVSNIHGERTQFEFDQALMKMVQSHTKFELLFSLLCPEPDVQLADWDIEQAVHEYLHPMLVKLKPLMDFHVGSQILYYTRLPYKPNVEVDNNGKKLFHFLTRDQLTHVVNPIESRLGSQVATDPTLNFVVYIANSKYTPLYIKKENGNISKSNAFLVPRWGSFVFYNMVGASKNPNGGPKTGNIEMKTVMSPLMSHFRTLLGIQSGLSHFSEGSVAYEQPNFESITDWELDYLMRLRTLENIASSTHTLNSLSKLLSQISNIVINDDIANEVYKAVNAISDAKLLLKDGNIADALNQSKIAFTASETAFFDPTLLELLYFPEDQKFAIYIPLFLPISLPILISLVHAIKRMKKNRKMKAE